MFAIPKLGSRDKKIPEAWWPVNLAKIRTSRLNEKPQKHEADKD